MQSVAQQVVSPRGKEGVVSAGIDHNALAAAALGAIDRRRRLCPRRQAGLPQQASGGSLEGTQIVVLGCADPGKATACRDGTADEIGRASGRERVCQYV